ncbi:MAG: heat-inducible transcriptional repressor HrcA [Bacillota bacterium]|nr:heat-inducible transcriptional repressor HrcA [Bacillota bacterium]
MRKQRVLEAIVEDYVMTAEPVSSRAIARKYQLGVSPATIRNEMADLEEMGMIEQPHTSAGRIPSQQGYRYYVDRLMRKSYLTAREETLFRAVFAQQAWELAMITQQTIKLVTQLTDYLVFLSGPQLAHAALQRIQFIPLTPEKALLVIVAETGWIESKIVELPVEVSSGELERITGVFNSYFRGLNFAQITRTLLQSVYNELSRQRQIIDLTLEIIESVLNQDAGEGLYLGGTRNILKQPEYKDIRNVRQLLDLVEEGSIFRTILTETEPTGVTVKIGKENKYSEVQNYSVVTGVYTLGGNVVGAFGLMGPMRMNYARAIAVVEYITQTLSEILSRSGPF